eukprot:TRINITY_DN109313_c0_g1_i1.p1 TRINITY_DN109313_c0_g1~~TRINITY_DN109313_c0_g1_i1.p1  ORF type:complete len:295 (+),score=85.31 TRINITY_DN109313_c0_g1_i1:70-885(+)
MFGATTFGSQSEGLALGFGASQATQGKKRADEKSICLPVTVRAIENAIAQSAENGGEVQFYGEQPDMLILVAAVEACNKQPASIEMTINDSTGRIKARYFITDGGSSNDFEEVVPGRYVNLYGQVRTTPMHHFAVVGMRPVKSADEVSYHTIEVAHTFLKLQKKRNDPVTPSPKKLVENVTPTKAMEVDSAPAAAAPTKPAALEGDALKAAVLAFLQKESESRGDTGLNIKEIVSQFGKSEDQVRPLLSQLVDEGEAFPTIDDDHYQAFEG